MVGQLLVTILRNIASVQSTENFAYLLAIKKLLS